MTYSYNHPIKSFYNCTYLDEKFNESIEPLSHCTSLQQITVNNYFHMFAEILHIILPNVKNNPYIDRNFINNNIIS